MKRTKIVATISERRCEPSFLKKLHHAGMDTVRLNTAHMQVDAARKVIKNVRAVSDAIAIMIDTKGPEVRTSNVKESLIFKKGDEVSVRSDNYTAYSTHQCLQMSYPRFVDEVPINSRILISDGLLELKVKKKTNDALHCIVSNDCTIGGRKGVCVKGAYLKVPSLSEKDRSFVQLAIDEDVEFIAHSFVRNKEDVLTIQRILDKKKSSVKIIAKIENQEGVDHIDEILRYAYGVMVARGDLAVEIPLENVPIVQKLLIRKCIEQAKPVITATQMLHTMIENPRPTRAEVSDVANAIYDGTDAIMLSGETAEGKYPVEAVQTMTKIALRVEKERHLPLPSTVLSIENKVNRHLIEAAVKASSDLHTKAVVIATTSGHSARIAASFRGHNPILAKCYSGRTVRELAIVYGTYAREISRPSRNHELVPAVLESLLKKDKLKTTDTIILLTGIPGRSGLTTSLNILTLKDAMEKFVGR